MKKFIAALLFFLAISAANIYADEIKAGICTASEYLCSGNINIGYAVDERYIDCGAVNGYNNLTFRPASGTYYKSNQVFGSYAEAKIYADNFTNAYPSVCGEKQWYVYRNISSKDFEKSVILGSFAVSAFFNGNNVFIADLPSDLQIAKTDGTFLSANGTEFRGRIELFKKKGSFTIINNIDIDEYICGVISSEMVPSWNKEALKAQAVVSRTYAVYTKDKHASDGYNVCTTSHCQNYKGVSGETELCNAAVKETKGELLYYDNQPINAVFSASSGGYTGNAADTWSSDMPYLKGVKDYFDTEEHKWSRTFTLSQLTNLAGNIGSVKSVTLKTGAKSGRVKQLILVGSSGTKVIEKDAIRSFFSSAGGSLKSTRFTFSPSGPQMYLPSSDNNALNIYETDVPKIEEDAENNIIHIISADNETIQISSDSAVLFDKNGKTQNKINYIIDGSLDISQLDNNISQPIQVTENTNNIIAETSENEELVSSTSTSQSITLYGAGFGHGVGLSQYGAKKMAEMGYNYKDILIFYYKGVTIK